jgi:hypothetical protein
MITPQTILLAALASVLIMLISAMAFYWVKMRPEPQDHEAGMYLAHKLWCDALDEAALSGDPEEYDRIKAIGWRKFSC